MSRELFGTADSMEDDHPTCSFKIVEAVLQHAHRSADYSIAVYLVKQRHERLVSIHSIECFHNSKPEEVTWMKLGFDAEWGQQHLSGRIKQLLESGTFSAVTVVHPPAAQDLNQWAQVGLEQRLPNMALQDLAALFYWDLDAVAHQCCKEPTKPARLRLRRSLQKRMHELGLRWPFRQVDAIMRAFRADDA